MSPSFRRPVHRCTEPRAAGDDAFAQDTINIVNLSGMTAGHG
jgi:hypothetical protein